LTSSHKYQLFSEPTDMRKSFDGLCGLIQTHLEVAPTSGTVFLFINKRKDKVKLLHWMGSGFVLYYKRLEQGVFEVPSYDIENGSIRINYTQLVMLIDGISITNITRSKRYLPTVESV
ncbi:MAG: IS66 family insertion sequence element accessory protein TnpB, partial [Crocinitomicaceae bacterium]|nr:IS66 family insertion sequence element accessory protein TnpB [Crocinitomicaceae bacterium]